VLGNTVCEQDGSSRLRLI